MADQPAQPPRLVAAKAELEKLGEDLSAGRITMEEWADKVKATVAKHYPPPSTTTAES